MGREVRELRTQHAELLRRLETAGAAAEEVAQSVSAATQPLVRQIHTLTAQNSQNQAAWERQERSLLQQISESAWLFSCMLDVCKLVSYLIWNRFHSCFTHILQSCLRIIIIVKLSGFNLWSTSNQIKTFANLNYIPYYHGFFSGAKLFYQWNLENNLMFPIKMEGVQ